MTPDASPGLTWLYGTQLYGMKLGLENVRRLLEALALPAEGQRFIHVAGTNGKGSTCAFMHSVLREAGVRAGLFTSPHLIRFNERIRDSERMISDAEVEAGLAKLRARVADWDLHPTFFELTLALALDWFRQRGLEWVVVETGLGGRLDASNALTPVVSVITRIGLDHMQQLGDTLAAIAGEKAGIIKPGVPVVTCPQEPEAQAALEAAAGRAGSELRVVREPLTGVGLSLPGPHQAWNAALAVAALQAAGIQLPVRALERGLGQAQWPARFQRIDGGRVVVDGAHNEDAARALVATWQQEFPGEKPTVIFGGSTGKDLAATLRALAPIIGRLILTHFGSPRSVPSADLLRAWRAGGVDRPIDVTTAESLKEALAAAAGAGAGAQANRLLITGSLFLAGEFLAQCDPAAAGYQASAQ